MAKSAHNVIFLLIRVGIVWSETLDLFWNDAKNWLPYQYVRRALINFYAYLLGRGPTIAFSKAIALTRLQIRKWSENTERLAASLLFPITFEIIKSDIFFFCPCSGAFSSIREPLAAFFLPHCWWILSSFPHSSSSLPCLLFPLVPSSKHTKRNEDPNEVAILCSCEITAYLLICCFGHPM